MARPLRIEFAGGFYHVTSRGNQRSNIFLGDDDRAEWMAILTEVAERFRWRVYAYCQMGNHYHLLVQTPQANLSRCMRHLNGVYTQRFNRHHHRCGHLLQGRYHAVIVDDQSYLLEVIRYVLLNPVRAGLVRHACEWKWSSFLSTAGEVASPNWLAVTDVLQQFSPDPVRATRAFHRFVDAGLSMHSPWAGLRQEIYLGDEAFVERTQALLHEHQRKDAEIPRPQRLRRPESLAEIFVNADDVSSGVLAAYRSGQFTMRQIADHLGVHYSTVSRLLARVELLDCKT
jgi:putative transposase